MYNKNKQNDLTSKLIKTSQIKPLATIGFPSFSSAWKKLPPGESTY